MLLHDSPDFADLLAVVAREEAIDPGLVEKDYWIMHGLWGLQQLGFTFELKGGTSLSKGYSLIHRFSEDIDILIHPSGDLPTGKHQNKTAHVDARRVFYDGLPPQLLIPGFDGAERDTAFDDVRMRSAGILHFGRWQTQRPPQQPVKPLRIAFEPCSHRRSAILAARPGGSIMSRHGAPRSQRKEPGFTPREICPRAKVPACQRHACGSKPPGQTCGIVIWHRGFHAPARCHPQAYLG